MSGTKLKFSRHPLKRTYIPFVEFFSFHQTTTSRQKEININEKKKSDGADFPDGSNINLVIQFLDLNKALTKH